VLRKTRVKLGSGIAAAHSWLFVASLALAILLAVRVTEKPTVSADTFIRQVECRKAAEALRQYLETMRVGDALLMHLYPAWKAHFSPKYDHCYAEFVDTGIASDEWIPRVGRCSRK
jgi:hypothetical protein